MTAHVWRDCAHCRREAAVLVVLRGETVTDWFACVGCGHVPGAAEIAETERAANAARAA